MSKITKEVLKKHLSFTRSKWFVGIACVVLGALIVLGIRFVSYKPDVVHYHANFGLYINGKREEFVGPGYYEEVQACNEAGTMQPRQRTHMHDNVNDVVHVHDHAVTWSDFFTNLGWTLASKALIAPDGTVYATNGNNRLHIMLNGQDRTDIGGLQNTVIQDEDRLLVSYGNQSSAALQKQFDGIANNAEEHDNTNDPATCSGSEHTSMGDRLKHMF